MRKIQYCNYEHSDRDYKLNISFICTHMAPPPNRLRNGCSTSSDFHEISIPWITGDGHKLQNGHSLCNKGKLSHISLIQDADKKTEIPRCPHFCDTVWNQADKQSGWSTQCLAKPARQREFQFLFYDTRMNTISGRTAADRRY